MFAQVCLEKFARDPAVPDLIGVRFVLRPWRFLPAQLDRRVIFEIGRLIELFLDLRDPIVHSLRVKIVDFVRRFQISEQHVIVQRRRVFRRQHVDVLLGEEEMAKIEQLEVGLEEFLRDFVVERLMGVMTFLEQPPHGRGDIPGV